MFGSELLLQKYAQSVIISSIQYLYFINMIQMGFQIVIPYVVYIYVLQQRQEGREYKEIAPQMLDSDLFRRMSTLNVYSIFVQASLYLRCNRKVYTHKFDEQGNESFYIKKMHIFNIYLSKDLYSQNIFFVYYEL